MPTNPVNATVDINWLFNLSEEERSEVLKFLEEHPNFATMVFRANNPMTNTPQSNPPPVQSPPSNGNSSIKEIVEAMTAMMTAMMTMQQQLQPQRNDSELKEYLRELNQKIEDVMDKYYNLRLEQVQFPERMMQELNARIAQLEQRLVEGGGRKEEDLLGEISRLMKLKDALIKMGLVKEPEEPIKKEESVDEWIKKRELEHKLKLQEMEMKRKLLEEEKEIKKKEVLKDLFKASIYRGMMKKIQKAEEAKEEGEEKEKEEKREEENREEVKVKPKKLKVSV